MPRAARKWTPDEDNLLSREVHTQLAEGKVKDWRVIADKISGRTNKDCRKRWHNALSGVFNKGYWTEEEDTLLTRAVQTHGETWTAVAEIVTKRSADQCAKRWKQFLDPQLDRSEWTEEENGRLVEVAAVKGRRWKEIQMEHFPSRSRNSIKNQYTILSRRESKLRNSRSRKVRQHQDHPATKETAHPTDSSPGDENDEMDCMDDESSYEEEEEAGSDEESSRWGPRNSPGDQRVSNSNSTLATPDEISAYAGLDASLWDNFPAGVSAHAWDPTIPSVRDTEYPGHYFNGTLPDLTTVFPDIHQSFGCNGSEVAKDGVYPSLPYPAHTDMSRFLDPGGLELAEVGSHQPAIMPLQGTDMARRNSQSSKVVLTVEEADHSTVESLMQIAFLSKSRFHLARE